MLDKDLLELLVCPACKTALIYDSGQDTLTCSQCGRVYPVRDGIPILLIDQPAEEA
jgi:LSD1 subclass zinc finger protein